LSETVSAVVPESITEDIDKLVKASGGRLTKSALIRRAVESFLEANRDEHITLDTAPAGSEAPSDRELADELRASFVDVIDFVPPISPKGETGSVQVAFSKDTLRALDVLKELPGVRQQTRADLIRSLVHYGLQAVDQMQSVDHPSWRAALVSMKQRQSLERQLTIAEDLYAGAIAFRDSLLLALERGAMDDAISSWLGYYQDAMLMPDNERGVMLRVLSTLPASRRVAWLSRGTGLVPEEMVPEVEQSGDLDPEDETGIPVPPQLQLKRDLQAAYARGYYKGVRQQSPAIMVEGPHAKEA
jgi:Arc/MetJ-type ribon-helix-helix transcriptional regulator